jgi:hypothetical protein
MLSAAKHLVLRPFASLRVTHKCANLVWFDLVVSHTEFAESLFRHARPSTALRTGSGGHPGVCTVSCELPFLDSRFRGNDATPLHSSEATWLTTRKILHGLLLV